MPICSASGTHLPKNPYLLLTACHGPNVTNMENTYDLCASGHILQMCGLYFCESSNKCNNYIMQILQQNDDYLFSSDRFSITGIST